MDLTLYHPECGYYARAPRRSGRAGDFFTSVDVGPLFGELLAVQIAQMAELTGTPFDLVEAGAADGRLSADIVRAIRGLNPVLFEQLRLHLVELSATSRARQTHNLGDVAACLASSSASLPDSFAGVLVANELLDAMPTHQVVVWEHGLREVYVDLDREGRLVEREGPPSTPELAAHLAQCAVPLQPGWRVEVNLRARDWVGAAAKKLHRGFLVLIDYGHTAEGLYSASHAQGTLTTFRRHTMRGPEQADRVPAWLTCPGEQDLTSHVDFTTVRRTAEAEGATLLAFMDQTYFLMALLESRADRALSDSECRAFKTLSWPGGLGSTFKVMMLGKGVGAPALAGCSSGIRVT